MLILINLHLLPLCSIPSGSLHFMSCASIRLLLELHSIPNSFPPSSSVPAACIRYLPSSTRNFQTTQYFPILLQNTKHNRVFVYSFYFFIFIYLFISYLFIYLFSFFMKNQYSKLELGN